MAFSSDVTIYVRSLGPGAAEQLKAAAENEVATVIAEQSARRGIKPLTTRLVDGRLVSDFGSVTPNSVVVLNWDYRAEMVAAAFEKLRARSPHRSGAYRDSFVALLDGVGLPPLTVPSPEQLADVSVVSISNPMPYARRLEVALTKSGAPFVKMVEPHIVESVSRALARDFGAVAKIGFNYVDLDNAYQGKSSYGHYTTRSIFHQGTFKRRESRGPSEIANRARVRYPAIIIEAA